MNNRQCVGLVGLGYWGKNLLRNLHELGVLRTACDADEATLRQKRGLCADVGFTRSFEDILDDPQISAVAVAAPAACHYELARKSLEAGKDVFVEKPLSLTVGQGEELIALAAGKKRVLMVGHILQYHPAVVKLKQLVRDGALGKIRYIYSNRLNIGKLRVEENILWSFAPHDISVILSLMNEEPVSVNAFGGDYLNHGVYDLTLTTLEFSNGIKGHIHVSWLHPFKEQKLVVVGSKAMAVFDDVSERKLLLYPHTIEWKDGRLPVAQKAEHQEVPFEPGEPLKIELEHFIRCVQERSEPLTDGREGLRVLKVLDAAQRSLSAPPAGRPGTGEGRPKAPRYFAHPTSVIDAGVSIGEGTKIWHFSHILGNTRIGNKCVVGQNVCIGPDVEVGNSCKIQNNVSLYKGVILEDEVFCGPSCVFTNVYNPRAFIERKNEFRPTRVKKGATIGANATIVCGATIGRYAFIGAGAVVKNDVPDYALVVGVPGQQKGWVCSCGVTLPKGKKKLVCPACGCAFRLTSRGLCEHKETKR